MSFILSTDPMIASSPRRGLRARRCEAMAIGTLTLMGAVSLPGSAHAAAPLNYLTSHGLRGGSILLLTWAVLIVSILVIIIVAVLLLAGLFRRRTVVAQLPGEASVSRPPGGATWIYTGVGITTLVLFGTVVWTWVTLAAVSKVPNGKAAVNIEVTGHQWWWEVKYLSSDVSREFTTANEIHIPTGEPVAVTLIGADVIHSFWVPALAGKTDVIPGQTNKTWFEATRPGVYRGQCAEYCGEQHAHMAFQVVASSPKDFQVWWNHQLEGAVPTASKPATDGENAFISRCGICHTVRGTRAGGRLGPDLTHVMSRKTIGAATLPNTRGYLSAWIANPQHIKPGNFMPQLDLSGPELASIRQYVETLK